MTFFKNRIKFIQWGNCLDARARKWMVILCIHAIRGSPIWDEFVSNSVFVSVWSNNWRHCHVMWYFASKYPVNISICCNTVFTTAQDLFDFAVVNESEDKAIAELQQCVANSMAEFASKSDGGYSTSIQGDVGTTSNITSNVSVIEPLPTTSPAAHEPDVSSKAAAPLESGADASDTKEAGALVNHLQPVSPANIQTQASWSTDLRRGAECHREQTLC